MTRIRPNKVSYVKEIYRRVQEEMGRRSSKRKVMQKTARTEKGKYSGKYAFSELLVCGECGSPYKRCTWVKKGRKRIVWRCVSRLEYGTKFCHQSPTMDGARLQRGVLDALNRYAANPEEVTRMFSAEINLFEHQSTWNPNMPLRGFIYLANLLEGYVQRNRLNIHGSRLLKLPTPHYEVIPRKSAQRDFALGLIEHALDESEITLPDEFALSGAGEGNRIQISPCGGGNFMVKYPRFPHFTTKETKP